jgi:hypothetical protein
LTHVPCLQLTCTTQDDQCGIFLLQLTVTSLFPPSEPDCICHSEYTQFTLCPTPSKNGGAAGPLVKNIMMSTVRFWRQEWVCRGKPTCGMAQDCVGQPQAGCMGQYDILLHKTLSEEYTPHSQVLNICIARLQC